MGKSKSSKKHMGISPKRRSKKHSSKKYRASPCKDIIRTAKDLIGRGWDSFDLCYILSKSSDVFTQAPYQVLLRTIQSYTSEKDILGNVLQGEQLNKRRMDLPLFYTRAARVAVKVLGGHKYENALEIARELGISNEYTDAMSLELAGDAHAANAADQSSALVNKLKSQTVIDLLSGEHLPSAEEAYKSVMSPVQVNVNRA